MIGIGWRSQRKRIFPCLICNAKYTEALYRLYLKVVIRNISDGFTCAETVLGPQRALEERGSPRFTLTSLLLSYCTSLFNPPAPVAAWRSLAQC